MKERPILFSAPMVRAILAGTKTQTRRVMNPQPDHSQHHVHRRRVVYEGDHRMWCWGNCVVENIWDFGAGYADNREMAAHCPYGKPSDHLYVKEAAWVWCRKVKNGLTARGRQKFKYVPHGTAADGCVKYVADHPQRPASACTEPDMLWRYKHARYMPKHLTRITLEITDVRVERLQDISEADAIAEGFQASKRRVLGDEAQNEVARMLTAKLVFQAYWDMLNAKKHPWVSNPWVWAISFKRVD